MATLKPRMQNTQGRLPNIWDHLWTKRSHRLHRPANSGQPAYKFPWSWGVSGIQHLCSQRSQWGRQSLRQRHQFFPFSAEMSNVFLSHSEWEQVLKSWNPLENRRGPNYPLLASKLSLASGPLLALYYFDSEMYLKHLMVAQAADIKPYFKFSQWLKYSHGKDKIIHMQNAQMG